MPGLDGKIIKELDFKFALKRILSDIGSDFIFAPYLNFIYTHAQDELIENLKIKLKSGKFEFTPPITINVPKKTRLTRPGSILSPLDRLLYQSLTDYISSDIESNVNKQTVFSHRIIDESEKMFEESSIAYSKYQSFIEQEVSNYEFAIKTDVSAYFETINQHTLINSLRNFRIQPELLNIFESALGKWNELSSRGILQGLFPSDLLGNFYLSVLDNYLDLEEIKYCRYVDDIIVFQKSLDDCYSTLVNICEKLRLLSLTLNDQKTFCIKSSLLLHQETEFDSKFNEIREELINLKYDEESFLRVNYGFQDNWDDYSEFRKDIEHDLEFNVSLVENLYSVRNEAKWQRDNIIKYCVPLLLHFKSALPLDSINEEIINEPHLTKIFARYYSTYERENEEVTLKLENLINSNKLIYDYQYLWLFSALIYRKTATKKTLINAIKILNNKNRHEALRAICPIVIGKFGDGSQKKILRDAYSAEISTYVKASILYSTQYLTASERNACRKAWGGHSEINLLLIRSFENMKNNG